MGKPIAYKTGTIQPPNTAKQSNIIVGVGPSNYGAGVANATFYNGLDSSFQYVIITGSNPPAFWGTGDFTTSSLLTTLNGLPDRVGQTPFTNPNTAISSSLATGKYTILKNEQVYGGPITNGLLLDFCPKVDNYFANGDFAYGTTIGWVAYGGSISISDITNDRPYVGSNTTKALINTGGGGFTWGRYTNPIYGPAGLLVVGQTYTFSFWAKVVGGGNYNFGFDNQNGSGDTSNWNSNILSDRLVTSTWKKFSGSFTYNIAKNFLYIYGPGAGGNLMITEMQLEDGTTAGPFSSFPVTAAGLTIPNNGLINSSSFNLNNGPYLVADYNGNIRLDGVDDSISIANSIDYTSFTISMWVKINSYNAAYTYLFDCPTAFFLRANSQAGAGSNSSWLVCNHGGPDGSETGTVYTGSITHIAYSYDGSLYSGSFYVNGIKTSGGSRPSNIKLAGNMVLGAGENNTNMNVYSTRIYNRTLSNAEIENLYNADLPIYQSSSDIMVNQGLTLYLDATNPNSYTSGSSTWYDISGYGNDGTLFNGVGFSSTYGGGLVFDGVDDYVNIAANSSLNASRPTVELVLTTSTNGGNIIAQGQYGSNWGFGVGVKPTNIMARNNNGDATISVSNSGLVHVVVVWDGSGNQYYKNGQYLGRTTANYSPNPGGTVTIGGVRSQVPSQNLQEFANSTVNIVRVYNRALSPTEILQNFNSIKTQFGL